MQNTISIILAAGKGTRMKSALPKVLHEILGLPLIYYPITLAEAFSNVVAVVVGHGREQVEERLLPFQVRTVVQDPPLGTGHAVLQARDILCECPFENVIVLPGDMPLVDKASLKGLIDLQTSSHAALGVLTATLDDPTGYGRILRDQDGRVRAIVEHSEASQEERSIREINTGVYVIRRDFLLEAASRLAPDNTKGEFYLTDIVAMAPDAVGFPMADAEGAHGINSQAQLAWAAGIMQQRINRAHMDEGLTLIDPHTTWISPLTRLGRDVTVWPNVHILGESVVGDHVTILPNTWIRDACIASGRSVPPGSIIEGKSDV